MKLYEILETNHGRCRVLIVESGRMELVHWLRHPAYLIDRKKIEPLLDSMLSKNKSFTSIKIISQIGQRRNPDEIIYTHAMVENVLFLGGETGEYQKMAELCKKLVDKKRFRPKNYFFFCIFSGRFKSFSFKYKKTIQTFSIYFYWKINFFKKIRFTYLCFI